MKSENILVIGSKPNSIIPKLFLKKSILQMELLKEQYHTEKKPKSNLDLFMWCRRICKKF